MNVTEFNQGVIDEFRANDGVVGGPFEGMQLLLLHSVGAKSGAHRINPLAYFEDGDSYLIIASNAGADKHPPWYFNLLASPEVRIEVGADEFNVLAEVLEKPTRTEVYDRIAAQVSAFAEYRAKTSRVIPILRLTRA